MNRQILLLYLALQVACCALPARGFFSDEGIYVSLGTAVLRGQNIDVSWLGGNPYLYPIASSLAYQVAGLFGARLLSALCVTFALGFFVRVSAALVGRQAATWALAALCVNGTLFSVAHLATYDAFALLGLMSCAWALFRPGRGPLALLSISLAAAFTALSKYTAIVGVVALLGVVLALLPRAPALKGAGAVVLGLLLASALTFVSVGQFFPVQAANAIEQQAGSPRFEVLTEWLYHSALPLLLGLTGVLAGATARRGLAVSLLIAACLWPFAHLIAGARTSLNKHVVYGYLFLYPLVGAALVQLYASRRHWGAACAVVLLGVGTAQSYVQDRLWVETRPLAEHLASTLQPGDRVGFEWGWALAPRLVIDGPLASALDVPDRFGLAESSASEVCGLKLIIVHEGGGLQSGFFRHQALRCGFVKDVSAHVAVWSQKALVPEYYRGRLVVYRPRTGGDEHEH